MSLESEDKFFAWIVHGMDSLFDACRSACLVATSDLSNGLEDCG